MSSGEQVLMQTATVEVKYLQKSRKVTTRLLLDTGSQRTYNKRWIIFAFKSQCCTQDNW